jgi:hypothetical protein
MGISVILDYQYFGRRQRSLHCTFLSAPSMVGIDSFDLATLQAASMMATIDAWRASNDDKLNISRR